MTEKKDPQKPPRPPVEEVFKRIQEGEKPPPQPPLRPRGE